MRQSGVPKDQRAPEHTASRLVIDRAGLMSRTFGEWAAVFGDAKMTTALRDRLTHHCHIVETGNESFRFRHSSANARSRIKARESEKRPKAALDITGIEEPF